MFSFQYTAYALCLKPILDPQAKDLPGIIIQIDVRLVPPVIILEDEVRILVNAIKKGNIHGIDIIAPFRTEEGVIIFILYIRCIDRTLGPQGTDYRVQDINAEPVFLVYPVAPNCIVLCM
jgi:hypothetical protein